MLPAGARVEIAFVKAPQEHIDCNPEDTYQLEAETGEIVAFHMESDTRFQGFGPSYLVKVHKPGRDRLRVIPENELTLLDPQLRREHQNVVADYQPRYFGDD